MNTTRRSFLATALTAAATAPLLGKATRPHIGIDPSGPGSDATDRYAEHVVRVEGLAIKVPSNRHRAIMRSGITDLYLPTWVYSGDWDGTFKEERGCSNPAYILADLYERTGAEPDWVVGLYGWTIKGNGEVTTPSYRYLNWPMLYHWGQWCDEMVMGFSDERSYPDIGYHFIGGEIIMKPRFTIDTVCHTREDMDRLRETLRMRCLLWQARDPRYRTSYPGVNLS